MSTWSSRYIIGIDLGTTNTAVSLVDTEQGERIEPLRIPQLLAPGEVGAAPLLPSFLYLPEPAELPAGALALPWGEEPPWAVGSFARDHGALVPGRLVASAKSWLAHGGVDRQAAILPWGGDAGRQAVSPVLASRRYLEHLRQAWDWQFAETTDRDGSSGAMANQLVVLTVPASFDEVARELTLAAARQAGLLHVVLLEEPLAAFYGWLSDRPATWAGEVDEGELVLIVDVGGGTTDFSLVQVESGPTLRRTAVGDHLLLGGDNMDMALARRVEAEWGVRLPPREWSQLCHQCRQAKETLLGPDAPAQVRLSVAAAGRSLVGGTRSACLQRQEVADFLLEGFFPLVEADTPPPTRGAGMRQMGLPYAAEPAVTRHLAAFLKQAAGVVPPAQVRQGLAAPTRVLFNGGSLLPPPLQQRLALAVARLAGAAEPVPVLATGDLTREVAIGAAYYGLVRRGRGVRVRGGIARAYFLEVAAAADRRRLCIMPRDIDEGVPIRLPGRRFSLATNRPAQFTLFSSSTRIGDRPGDLVDAEVDLTALPPMTTVVGYGKGAQKEVDVELEARLDEIGTLNIACLTLDGHHRFPLSFNLRRENETGSADAGIERIVEEGLASQAVAAIERLFEAGGGPVGAYDQLEAILCLDRQQWGVSLLRQLADRLLANPEWRTRTAALEARWLNLAGFCLRPGVGAAGDAQRLDALWKLWAAGPLHPGKPQVACEWWIFWRRLAGGLVDGRQQQVGGALLRELLGEGGAPILSARGAGAQILREQWRCLGALERLPLRRKSSLLRKLSESGPLEAHLYWVLARLAARHPLHAPENAIIPAETVETALAALLPQRPDEAHARRLWGLALVNACRVCGVRNLEVEASWRQQVADALAAAGLDALAEQALATAELSRRQTGELLGDSLPPGLAMKG